MLDLASHIVAQKKAHFEPEKFEDQYEDALKELLKKKRAGEKDRSAQAARGVECGQPHGCAAREHQSGERRRARC